jgi:phosphoribosylglycinamide formyltransferase 1
MPTFPPSPLPLVVLLSGRGSNFQALLQAIQAGRLNAVIRAVISNRPGAAGLAMAEQADIPTAVVDHREYEDRDTYDAALRIAIDTHAPALVVLAGFMRILTPAFVRHYEGRLINIHPSLLPHFRGLDTHARALQESVTEHGASVHFVTEELDGGPVILQARVAVHPGDTEELLAARVLKEEHRLYPAAVELIASGRVRWREHRVWLDDKPLETPLLLDHDLQSTS